MNITNIEDKREFKVIKDFSKWYSLGIKPGAILRKKLKKYYDYYIVVGFSFESDSFECIRFYKKLPSEDKLREEFYKEYISLTKRKHDIELSFFDLERNNIELFNFVTDNLLNNINTFFTDEIKNFNNMVAYINLVENIDIGYVIKECRFNNIVNLYVVTSISPFKFILILNSDIKTELDLFHYLGSNDFHDTIKVLKLSKFKYFLDRCNVFSVDKVSLLKVINKLKLLGRLEE